jgi:hypothetical protein
MALTRLGLRPAEFGRMSVGYFGLLCRELEAEDWRQMFPQAAVRAMLATCHSTEKSKVWEPIDFMPGWERDEERRIATVDELITMFGAVRKEDGEQ